MRRLVAGALLLAGAGAVWARRNPSPCPYSQSWLLYFPRPGLSTDRLCEILEPRPGERVLELGPGTGYHALEVARRLDPGGTLDAVDVQEPMLDALMQRARNAGIANIVPTAADARSLPFPDATFDAAYLVTVLGEVPDSRAALREIRRVIKPSGRLVVGEIPPLDPHFVSAGALREMGEGEGFRFIRRLGPPLWFFARFEPA